MNEEMTEILINKFIDSEITPAEGRLLDAELARNPRAAAMLSDLQALRDQSRQLLGSELRGREDSARTVLSQALRERGTKRRPRAIRLGAWKRAGVSIAACLVLGLGIYLNPLTEAPKAQDPVARALSGQPAILESRSLPRGENVPSRHDPYLDVFVITNPDGSRTLVESYRDSDVTTASYYNGL